MIKKYFLYITTKVRFLQIMKKQYKIFYYTENIIELNERYITEIQDARDTLEYKNTKAYKNKILKSQQGLKNPGETVVNLITEERYNIYTQTWSLDIRVEDIIVNLNTEESLLSTMTIYQKWIYLLFNKDIR